MSLAHCIASRMSRKRDACGGNLQCCLKTMECAWDQILRKLRVVYLLPVESGRIMYPSIRGYRAVPRIRSASNEHQSSKAMVLFACPTAGIAMQDTVLHRNS